jgi:hypothetical protein
LQGVQTFASPDFVRRSAGNSPAGRSALHFVQIGICFQPMKNGPGGPPMDREQLDNITEPYDPWNPPPGRLMRAWISANEAVVVLLILGILLAPVIVAWLLLS